ncbi:hypothetical protein [Microbacterium sp. GXF6406]
MNPLDFPEHIWGWSGAIIVAAIAAVGVITGHVIGSQKSKRDDLQALVDQLQEEIHRVSARVETLEQTRDAYRSWSHVLWAHLHDERTPRLPPPSWPIDLPR